MSNYPVHVNFPGRLVFVGFGSIGQGVLPLILPSNEYSAFHTYNG